MPCSQIFMLFYSIFVWWYSCLIGTFYVLKALCVIKNSYLFTVLSIHDCVLHACNTGIVFTFQY